MKKRILAILIFSVIFSNFLLAASSSSSSSSSSTSAEPYTKEEFPDWAKCLRRFEIVTIGSLPFTTMSATTVFTTIRWIKNDFSTEYIPNPFAFTSTEAGIDEDEQKIVLYSAIGASLVVGLVDISIYIAKIEKAKKANRSVLPSNVSVKNKSDKKQAEENEVLDEEQNDTNANDKIKLPKINVEQVEEASDIQSIDDEPDVKLIDDSENANKDSE